MTTQAEKAQTLARLHAAPEILRVVNVWDAVSARTIAALPETRAIATAGHSIAASFGYPDGEIPLELTLDMVGRIVEAVGDLPVTTDLDDGYGDPGETVRRVIGKGAVGANIEDRLAPLDEAVAAVEAVVAAGAAEGVPFVLNARTDAFLRAGDRDPADVLADAVERGRAFLDAGAPVVFVPGKLDEEQVSTLVEAFGPQRLTVIGVPGSLPLARLDELGVARISFGPNPQRVALTALQELVESVHAGAGLPASMRILT